MKKIVRALGKKKSEADERKAYPRKNIWEALGSSIGVSLPGMRSNSGWLNNIHLAYFHIRMRKF